MSIKALSLVASAAALLLGGFAYVSSASAAVNPITVTTIPTVSTTTVRAPVTRSPARPPARSLYRPGPRNPVGTLE